MLKIVLASNNKHKLSEFQGCFAQKGIEAEIIPLSETGFTGDIPEDAETFEGNAYIKAKTISDYTGAIVIADDSGLCVDALNGAPGVYSARYAEGGGDKANTEKLLAELKKVPDLPKTARFVCVICAVKPNGETMYVRGESEGEIVNTPAGENGFGYDPVFYCPKYKKTFAQLTDEEKNSVSHRGIATEKLADRMGFFADSKS